MTSINRRSAARAFKSATYTGAFTPIATGCRSQDSEGARLICQAGSSFNRQGWAVRSCQGRRRLKIEMHFLPDVYVTGDVCKANVTTARRSKCVQGQVDRRRARHDRRGGGRIVQGGAVDPLQMETLSGGLTMSRLSAATTLSGGRPQRVSFAKECRAARPAARLHPRRADHGAFTSTTSHIA